MIENIAKPLLPLVLPIEQLNLDPANARKHDDRNIEAIKASLARFGQRQPIVVQKQGMVVRAGNARLLAAKALGWTKMAALVVDDDDLMATAYALADNRTAELAEWDDRVLADLLKSLQKEPRIDELVTGFDEKEIKGLLAQAESGFAGAQVDEIPETPKDPITKPGDLWELGHHRLFCADSTKRDFVSGLMISEKATVCVTDPPWNVAIGGKSNAPWRQRTGLANDTIGQDFGQFLISWIEITKEFLVGDMYCFMGAGEWPAIDQSFRRCEYHWSGVLVWVKDSFAICRSNYQRRFEPIWYGWKADGKSSFRGRRDLDDVWECPRPRASEEHPTMKPIDLMGRAIQNSSEEGQIVLDPFLGSGSTLLAAHQLKRRCFGMEISPGFCDVVVERWQNLTGQKAKRIKA